MRSYQLIGAAALLIGLAAIAPAPAAADGPEEKPKVQVRGERGPGGRPNIPVLMAADSATSPTTEVGAVVHKDLDHLMEAMKGLHKASADKDPAVAKKAAQEIGRLAKTIQGEKMRVDEKQFVAFAKDLETANAKLVAALDQGADRPTVMMAFKGQTDSCSACHKVYREEDSEEGGKKGGRRGEAREGREKRMGEWRRKADEQAKRDAKPESKPAGGSGK